MKKISNIIRAGGVILALLLQKAFRGSGFHRILNAGEADQKELSEKWLYAVSKVFEMDGAVSYLHLESEHHRDTKVTIRMNGQKAYGIGQIISFTPEESKMHFFDAKTGFAIR